VGILRLSGINIKLQVGTKEFFVDLLLYHRKLQCLVAVELKISEFKPEFSGKMQFYLTVLDVLVKLEEENPSIGIIICKSKDRTVVEYALKQATNPIGVSTYKILRKLPKEIKKYLPSPDEISKEVSAILQKSNLCGMETNEKIEGSKQTEAKPITPKEEAGLVEFRENVIKKIPLVMSFKKMDK